MKIIVAALLCISSLVADDLSNFLREAEKNIDPEAKAFLEENTLCHPGLSQAKCSNSKEIPSDLVDDHSLKIFISFSCPLEVWKDLSKPLTKLGGVFILRGLPDNSFGSLAEKIKHLRNEGVEAPILIDSQAYKAYRAHHTPCMALTYGRVHDKIIGNMPLREALRTFAEHGQTPSLSREYLQKLDEGSP